MVNTTGMVMVIAHVLPFATVMAIEMVTMTFAVMA